MVIIFSSKEQEVKTSISETNNTSAYSTQCVYKGLLLVKIANYLQEIR